VDAYERKTNGETQEMTDESIQHLIDTNYRLLTLLGFATSLIVEMKNFLGDETRSYKQCEWFLKALNNVVYLKKPLPEFL
jgi:hypothetical protein